MTNKQRERWVAEVREDFPYLDHKIWDDDALITSCALTTRFEDLPDLLQKRILLTAIRGVYKNREFTKEQAVTALNNFMMNCGLIYALKAGILKISSVDGKFSITKKGRQEVENDL